MFDFTEVKQYVEGRCLKSKEKFALPPGTELKIKRGGEVLLELTDDDQCCVQIEIHIHKFI